MAGVLETYSGEVIEAAGLDDVAEMVAGVEEWDWLDLKSETATKNGSEAVLSILVDTEHGVMVRYGEGAFEDEFVFTADSDRTQEETVETWDGGDQWKVPVYYFHSWAAVATVVAKYLEDGLRHQPQQWVVLAV